MLKETPKSDPVLDKFLGLVSAEFDLIQGIEIVSAFDYSILPVQVRLAENRFEIVSDLLRKNEHAYKSHEKLVKLADLLRVSDLQVMLAIAEYACERKNQSVLTQMCTSLVKRNHGPAWSCVHKLAVYTCKTLIEQHKIILVSAKRVSHLDTVYFESVHNHAFNFNAIFNIYSSREKTMASLSEIERLLSFVLTYCSSDVIEEVLYQKSKIEQARENLEVLDEFAEKAVDDSLRFEKIHAQETMDFNSANFRHVFYF